MTEDAINQVRSNGNITDEMPYKEMISDESKI